MRRRQIREALGSEREALLSQLTEQMVSRSQTKQPCFFFFFPRPVEAENIALVRLLNLSGAGLWGNLTYVHERTNVCFIRLHGGLLPTKIISDTRSKRVTSI